MTVPPASVSAAAQQRPRWRHLAHALPWLLCIGFFFVGQDYLGLATYVLVMILFALSLDLALGYGGIVTLGHAAFFGLGAYAAGIFAIHVTNEPILGLLLATAVAGLFGLVTGAVILHTRGVALLMLTLAIAALTFEAANQARWLTGGDDGLSGIRMAPLLGMFRFSIWSRTEYFYALAVLAIWFAFAWVLVKSPFGRSVNGIRQNVARMRAIGTPVWLKLVVLYAISAAMAGTAGALSAQTSKFVGLNSLSFIQSGTVLIMLILGGTGRLYGAFTGVVAYTLIHEYASQWDPYYWMLVMGVALMLIVVFLDQGLNSIFSSLVKKVRARA